MNIPKEPVDRFTVTFWHCEYEHVYSSKYTYYANATAAEVWPDSDREGYPPFVDQWLVESSLGVGRLIGWDSIHNDHDFTHYDTELEALIVLRGKLTRTCLNLTEELEKKKDYLHRVANRIARIEANHG